MANRWRPAMNVLGLFILALSLLTTVSLPAGIGLFGDAAQLIGRAAAGPLLSPELLGGE